MKRAMGIILTGGKNNRLKELSLERSIAAVPYGGKYRAIDFVLSNLVNSGIVNVGVITQYNFRSLVDHLGSGKEWDLDRKNEGLFIFPPYLSEVGTGWYKGTADAMYNNLTYLSRSDDDYVVISQGYAIYNMDYSPMIDEHIRTGADITLACHSLTDFSVTEQRLLGMVEIDENGRITDLLEKPLNPKSEFCSMGVYVIRRTVLIELLQDCAAHGHTEFVNDLLIKNVNTMNFHAYRFGGYWRPLSTIQLFYRSNMELLDPKVRAELLMDRRRIFTKVKDETPAKYNEEADVRNSIVADGCIIEGTVENSILFRGVKIMKGAVVKDSIIMQGSSVCENVSLNHTILDKGVVVTKGKQLQGDKEWPLIVGKNVTV
jgi:glucose-1-phosphate adenylyltransferase